MESHHKTRKPNVCVCVRLIVNGEVCVRWRSRIDPDHRETRVPHMRAVKV